MTSSYQSNHDELFHRLDDQMRSYRKTITQSNNYSNKKVVSKAEIKQASQFLHTQHDRLSNIESSFPQLVDLLLEKDQDKLSLNALSNQMRHLHSLHAKQILHIESLLVTQFGYQNSYLKEDTNTSSTIQQQQKTKLNQMLLQTRTRNEEIYFEQDIVGGPLSRLSEATYETDATVTPMSMSLNSVGLSLSGNPYSGSRRKRTPGGSFVSIREHDDENLHGGGLKLEQELDMETEERGSPPKSSFQKDDLPKTPNLKELQLSDATLSFLEKSSPPSSVSDSVVDSMEDHENDDKEISEDGSFHPSLDDSFDLDEIREACESMCQYDNDDAVVEKEQVGGQQSNIPEKERTGSVENIIDYPQNEQSEDNSYESEESEDDFDDEDDTTLSITSTVVRDVNRVRQELNLTNDDSQECPNWSESRIEEKDSYNTNENESKNLDQTIIPSIIVETSTVKDLDQAFLDSMKEDENKQEKSNPIDCSITRIQVGNERSDTSVSIHDVQGMSTVDFADEGSETESEESFYSVGTESEHSPRSTIDTSLYLQSPNHLEEVDDKYEGDDEVESDNEKGADCSMDSEAKIEVSAPRNSLEPEASMSPLDRFQVQLLSGGTECKVTPLGGDIMKASNSPIVQVTSPVLPSSVSSREKRKQQALRKSEASEDDSESIIFKQNEEEPSSSFDDEAVASASFQSPQVKRSSDPVGEMKRDTSLQDEASVAESIQTDLKSFVSSHTPFEQDDENERESILTSRASSTHKSLLETNISIENSNDRGFLENTLENTVIPEETSIQNEALGTQLSIRRASIDRASEKFGRDSSLSKRFSQGQKTSPLQKSPQLSSTPITGETPKSNAAISSIMSRTPRAAAFIEKHMGEEDKGRLIEVLQKATFSAKSERRRTSSTRNTGAMMNLDSDFASESPRKSNANEKIFASTLPEDDDRLINPVSLQEYESAAPIIRKLISCDDLNRGIIALNNWLISQGDDVPSSFAESTAADIIGKTFEKKQVKRIFPCLCSLHRMMIIRKKNGSNDKSEMHYVIYKEKK